jgi:hypothetical protein
VPTDQPSLGSIIVSLQQTQHDACSALRIFSTIDVVMQLLAVEMGLPVADIRRLQAEDVVYVPTVPPAQQEGDTDVFWIPYAADGSRLQSGAPLRRLDLREDAEVTLTSGPYKGIDADCAPSNIAFVIAVHNCGAVSKFDCESGYCIHNFPSPGDTGIVQSKQSEGHFKIQFRHEISRGAQKSFKAPMVRVLGTWYLEAGTLGTLPSFPLATLDP